MRFSSYFTRGNAGHFVNIFFSLVYTLFSTIGFSCFSRIKKRAWSQKEKGGICDLSLFSQRIIEEVLPEKGAFSRFSLPELLKFYVSSRSDPIFQIALPRIIRLVWVIVHR